MPETPSTEKDPIASQSLSGLLVIFSFILMGTLVWALYDEVYATRPWKGYQARFVQQYISFLQDKAIPAQAQLEREVRESEEFQRLEQELAEAEEAIRDRIGEIDREINRDINPKISVLNKVFAEVRGQVQALTYKMEVATSEGTKEARARDIAQMRQRVIAVDLPTSDGDGSFEEASFNYASLEGEWNRLKVRKAGLQTERIQLQRPAGELREARNAYLQDHLVGLTEAQMEGLVRNMEAFRTEIKQIHVADVDLVDRCESCHLGTREPVTLTQADMGGEAVFTSHPRMELLEIHDPEQFGCTPCHNGNGRATSSIVKGHGRHKFWLWPLYHRENIESGCQQCHTNDLYLRYAETLSQGKNLFDHRGCVGCHRYEGYDTEGEQYLLAQQVVSLKNQQRYEHELEVERSIARADQSLDDDEANRLYSLADNLRVEMSGMDTELEQMNIRLRSLLMERKKVAPSLKEVRVKLRKEWIPVWLENPHAFRPSTRMPAFRLEEQQRQAIAAFIWQSGVEGTLPSHPRGDATQGKELFETRGCMACHSVGEGEEAEGGTFAANLTRVGEKANYDYLVRWVHNPRERTRPYCPLEKRDLGPEDYERHGLPFVFDLDHSTCPNDGAELLVQQMTVMPNLRLTVAESRHIATYLTTLRQSEAEDYPPAPYMDDPALMEEGFALVRHFGCAGCHEISGLEEEGRIGTELTKEGSKPIERLDFALLTHEAESEGWYNHKGFFEHKLENPAVFDERKEKTPLEKLRMPNFNLKPEEITALTTFLLGSTDAVLPARYFYQPEDQRRDIQEGWEIIMKYNCMGCHVVRVGQRSVLMDIPRYQDPDWREQLPPSLIGEGGRVDPVWLAHFLENPAMSETSQDRNGVRPYLQARMPTFSFSQGEIRRIVRFFEALSSQVSPYIPPSLEPLSNQERLLARQLFTSQGAPCLECHAIGDPIRDQRATAPNFLLSSSRLKPGWTTRWMLDPSMMSPGTAMPSGLFRQEGGRWVFAGPTPPGFRQYDGDHAELLVRYIFEFSAQELRRITGR
ncbi:MAG: c-type cytochrome [Acidobacteria bacterium]|nr:c-type cytochrome [Acidobacteriota bacterium]